MKFNLYIENDQKQKVWKQLEGHPLFKEMESQRIQICEDADIDPSAKIGYGTTISSKLPIESNAKIGEFVKIDPDVKIGPNCEIDSGVHVHHNANTKPNCKIRCNTTIESDVFISSGTIIGSECYIGAGTVIGPNSTIHNNIIIPAKAFMPIKVELTHNYDCIVINPIFHDEIEMGFGLTMYRSNGKIYLTMPLTQGEVWSIQDARKYLADFHNLLSVINFAESQISHTNNNE